MVSERPSWCWSGATQSGQYRTEVQVHGAFLLGWFLICIVPILADAQVTFGAVLVHGAFLLGWFLICIVPILADAQVTFGAVLVADLVGKIYIFGGGAKLGTPFAEVFDPLLKRVEKVEGPNDFWKLAGVDRVSKRFLFIPCISLDEKVTKTKTGPVIFYETKTNQWNHETHPKLGHEIDWLFDYSGCVVVATTIYWFSEVDVPVNAYDFVNNKFYYSTILSDLPDDWEDAFPFLFHMSEDYFCIVWVLRKKIHCTKFHISKCTTHKKLRVYVMDTDRDDILAEMGLQKQHVNYGHLLALLTS
ncbi:hypothetical protein LguiB_013903 [Lonicera macranthoides]